MIATETIPTTTIITGIACDRCGRNAEPDGDTCYEYQEFLCIKGMGGYSSVFGDEYSVVPVRFTPVIR